eukprot:UN13743
MLQPTTVRATARARIILFTRIFGKKNQGYMLFTCKRSPFIENIQGPVWQSTPHLK